MRRLPTYAAALAALAAHHASAAGLVDNPIVGDGLQYLDGDAWCVAAACCGHRAIGGKVHHRRVRAPLPQRYHCLRRGRVHAVAHATRGTREAAPARHDCILSVLPAGP